MNTIFLTIASVAAALSPQNQPSVEYITKNAEPAIKHLQIQVQSFSEKQQMLESGMTQMDGYHRYLKDPMMTLNATRNA